MKTLYLLAFLSIAPLHMGAKGSSFVIMNGQTETDTQVLEDMGDSGVIAPLGAINTTNENGVNMENDEQTLQNLGTITTAGDDAIAVFNDGGSDSSITSGGTITTTGDNAYAIWSIFGNDVLITNSGIIGTQGESASAILTNGNNNVITNSGNITTSGSSANGIATLFSDSSEITNSGSINTNGVGANGILNDQSTNSTITNSGLIQTEGTNARGILNSSSNEALVTNSGTIETIGQTAHGIENINSSNGTINNNGSIQTEGTSASGVTIFQSADTVINNNGSIQTNGSSARGISITDSNTSTISNSGTIQTEGSSASGVAISNSNNSTITNSGWIQTEGSFGRGMLLSDSSNISALNTGMIKTLNSNSDGIQSNVSGSVINQGIIHTVGNFSRGISQTESSSPIINQGTIRTEGQSSHGFYSFVSIDAEFIQSGSIETSGQNSHGIFIGDLGRVVTNSGSVTTSGSGSHAIFFDQALPSFNLSIFNSGHLLAQGENGDGFRSTGNGEILITNSGTIESLQGFALNFMNQTPILTSLPCSKIIGPVQSTNPLNFNVPTPFNMVLTLTEDSAGFGALSINAPFVLSGNTIAILDPRAFAPLSDIVADLSDTLLNSLSNPCSTCCTLDSSSFWVEAIGSTRERGSGYERYRFRQGGFLAGFTSYCFGGAPLSLFGGAVFGKIRPSGSECNLDLDPETKSYVAGISLRSPLCNGCLFLSLLGGTLEIDQNRTIFDNLAEDGVLEVKGSRSGLFLTPEASLRQLFCLQNRPVSMTATLRYAGFFPSNYSDPLSEGGLHLKSKWVSLLTGRFLLGLPYGCMIGKSCLNIEPYVGAAGRFQLSSNNYRGTLLGQNLLFTSGVSRNIGSFIYGVKACTTACNTEFYLSFEGSEETEDSRRFIGSAGLAFHF